MFHVEHKEKRPANAGRFGSKARLAPGHDLSHRLL